MGGMIANKTIKTTKRNDIMACFRLRRLIWKYRSNSISSNSKKI